METGFLSQVQCEGKSSENGGSRRGRPQLESEERAVGGGEKEEVLQPTNALAAVRKSIVQFPIHVVGRWNEPLVETARVLGRASPRPLFSVQSAFLRGVRVQAR